MAALKNEFRTGAFENLFQDRGDRFVFGRHLDFAVEFYIVVIDEQIIRSRLDFVEDFFDSRLSFLNGHPGRLGMGRGVPGQHQNQERQHRTDSPERCETTNYNRKF